jgi:hypothetical protein
MKVLVRTLGRDASVADWLTKLFQAIIVSPSVVGVDTVTVVGARGAPKARRDLGAMRPERSYWPPAAAQPTPRAAWAQQTQPVDREEKEAASLTRPGKLVYLCK